MHGIAAKIPEEVSVFLQHQRVDAGAAEQIAEHHAGRAAADDAASGVDRALEWSLRRSARVHDLTFVETALSAGNS
jgi:hypothetical protein